MKVRFIYRKGNEDVERLSENVLGMLSRQGKKVTIFTFAEDLSHEQVVTRVRTILQLQEDTVVVLDMHCGAALVEHGDLLRNNTCCTKGRFDDYLFSEKSVEEASVRLFNEIMARLGGIFHE